MRVGIRLTRSLPNSGRLMDTHELSALIYSSVCHWSNPIFFVLDQTIPKIDESFFGASKKTKLVLNLHFCLSFQENIYFIQDAGICYDQFAIMLLQKAFVNTLHSHSKTKSKLCQMSHCQPQILSIKQTKQVYK